MSARRKMKEYVKQRVIGYRPKPSKGYGRIGNLFTNAVDVPGKTNTIYVTLEGSGQVVEAVNGSVPSTLGMPVVVGLEPESLPKTLQVLSARNTYTADAGLSVGPPNHHETHEWPNYDTVYVRSEQFLPGDYFPVPNSLTVKIWPDTYLVNGIAFPIDLITTIDLSSYVAALASNECQFVTISVDGNTGDFVVKEGAVKTGWANLSRYTDIPAPEFAYNWVCAVNLFYGQTHFRKDGYFNDFVDLRFMGVKSGTAVSGSITVKELDGTPSVSGVSVVRFPNGVVTDDGSGQVTIDYGLVSGAYVDLTAQMGGGNTHFDFTDNAAGIQVYLDGVMQPTGITFTPNTHVFDTSFVPSGTTFGVVRLAPVVTQNVAQILLSDFAAELVNDTTETTIATVSIPAYVLGTHGQILCKILANLKHSVAGTLTLKLKYGATTLYSLVMAAGSAIADKVGTIELSLSNLTATSQKGIGIAIFGDANYPYTQTATGTASEDSTTGLDFVVTAQWSAANSGLAFTAHHITVENITL